MARGGELRAPTQQPNPPRAPPSRPLPLTPVDGEREERQAQRHLDVQHLHGVDGGDGEGGRVLVGVVQLVEVLVQPGRVVEPVQQVRHVVLPRKKSE